MITVKTDQTADAQADLSLRSSKKFNAGFCHAQAQLVILLAFASKVFIL